MITEYVPPAIVRRGGSLGLCQRNPHAHASCRPHDSIAGVPVADLTARFGSPLFVFSEEQLRAQAKAFKDAFRSRHPHTTFAWSYKTNYLGAICRVFHDEGWIAEVVSDFEYEKARKLGIDGRDIVFNGPHKPLAALERAVADGAQIQVDHWDELRALESIAGRRGQCIPVALRVWLDAGIRPVWSKFGLGLETGEAWRAIEHIRQSRGLLRLRGLHTHIGTYILDPAAYRVASEKLVLLAERCREEFRRPVEYLNLGGGLPSRSTLHFTYLPPEQAIPPLDAYAEAICGPILALPLERRPRLYLESGRALVDEAGYLVTTVVASKQASSAAAGPVAAPPSIGTKAPVGRIQHVPESLPTVIVDAGVHLLYTGAWFRFNVHPCSVSPNAPASPVRLCGALCMNIDVLREQVMLPPLSPGDRLVLHPVGAYNITQSMQFITYRPAVVLVDGGGNAEVIRERENLEAIDRLERVPDRLRPSPAIPGKTECKLN
jgi:diaminopimelate decarboxylase